MFWTGFASPGGKLRQALRSWGAVVVTASSLAAGAGIAPVAWARPPAPAAVAGEVALTALPPQAQTTYRLILNGGPFPYEKDGSVFGNRERLLPARARGYYREYTVKTPRARNRGARRIVCGGQRPTQPDSCYYSDDHYARFRTITP